MPWMRPANAFWIGLCNFWYGCQRASVLARCMRGGNSQLLLGCTMKRVIQKLGIATLALAVFAEPALADWGRRHHGPGPSHHYNPYRHHNHHHRPHGGGADWVAPLLFLGLAGAAIGAAATPSPPPVTYVQPPPVVVQPPVITYAPPPMAAPAPPAAPAGTWYYCASASMYYPHTQHCPEGWQAVRPHSY